MRLLIPMRARRREIRAQRILLSFVKVRRELKPLPKSPSGPALPRKAICQNIARAVIRKIKKFRIMPIRVRRFRLSLTIIYIIYGSSGQGNGERTRSHEGCRSSLGIEPQGI